MNDALTRGYVAADAPALAELMNQIERYGGGHPGYTADELQGLIATLVRSPDRDSKLVFAGQTLVAAAFTTTPPEGGWRLFITGGVHPRWRGRGLGRELLGWQLARAREIHRQERPGIAWQAQVRTPTGDEDAARLYRRFGVAPSRYWFEMEASTADPPRVAVPEGLRLAAYDPACEAALYAAHMESFAGSWGFQPRDQPSWLALTVRADSFLSGLSQLAFGGDELVGYVLSYEDADPSRAYVGHLGVRSAWRGRGLARALLARVLELAGRTGRTTVGLSVDADSPTGAAGVYQRAGFRITSEAVTYATAVGD